MTIHDASAPAAAGTDLNTRSNGFTPTMNSYDATAKTFSAPPDADEADDSSPSASKLDIGLASGNKTETLSVIQGFAKLSEDSVVGSLPHCEIDFGAEPGGAGCDERAPEQPKVAAAQTKEAKEPGKAPAAPGEPALPSARAILGLPEIPEEPDAPDAPEEPDDPEAPEAPEPDFPPMPTPVPVGVTENPFIRNKLEEAKIDPSKTNGIKIGVIDRNFPNGHGGWVESVINDKDAGLIPGADPVEIYNNYSIPSFADFTEKPNGINAFIHESAVDFVKSATEHISSIVKENDPAMRVVNMSFGLSNTKLAETMMNSMSFDPKTCLKAMSDLLGPEKAEKLMNSATGGGDFKDKELKQELMQAIVSRVNEQVANDPDFKKAMDDYRTATKTAAEHGINIVVSAGNQQDKLKAFEGIKTEPGAHYNYLAQSNDVISVGATNINESEGTRTDDTVADFSSHGTSEYSPTVVAHGEHVQIDGDRNSSGISGTSFAAPEVAATVALMLAQNPKLTAKEVKTMLQENTVKIPDTPKEAQGAGILISEEAIIAAKKSAA